MYLYSPNCDKINREKRILMNVILWNNFSLYELRNKFIHTLDIYSSYIANKYAIMVSNNYGI